MAQKTVRTDDLDGAEGAEEVTFAFKNTKYSIDLTEKNVDRLAKALQPFIDKAQKVGGATRTGGNGSTPRIDYSDPAYAGRIHRGKITDAEKKTVRDHLERVNENLKKDGMRTIDRNNAEHKAKYGL